MVGGWLRRVPVILSPAWQLWRAPSLDDFSLITFMQKIVSDPSIPVHIRHCGSHSTLLSKGWKEHDHLTLVFCGLRATHFASSLYLVEPHPWPAKCCHHEWVYGLEHGLEEVHRAGVWERACLVCPHLTLRLCPCRSAVQHRGHVHVLCCAQLLARVLCSHIQRLCFPRAGGVEQGCW